MNIFIVASPLQLLNTIEAANHFTTVNNILIILKIDRRNYNQMKKLLTYFKWDKIIYFDLPKTNLERLLFPIKFHLLVQNFISKKVKNVFFGEYRSPHIQHMVNYFNCSTNYLVDDGLATLNIEKKQNLMIKARIRLFLYKLFLYKLKKIKFSYFTIFDIEQTNIIKNNYNFLQNLNRDKHLEESIYFIGQPLVELSMISREQYKIELKKIINFYPSKTFIYILHRREEEEHIKDLSLKLDFNYKRLDKLIEMELITETQLPSDIATFYSSAIITLSYLFNKPKYKAFKIDSKKLKINFYTQEAIEKCYIEFEEHPIKVIKL